MRICTKCKVEQDDKEYYKYYHSRNKNFYTRWVCLTCTRKQARDYKSKIKKEKQILEQVPQEEKIIQPVVQELQPGYKECSDCYEVKQLDNFYLNAYKNPMKKCKSCYNNNYKKNSDEYNKDRGGSERVMLKPNTYTDIWQKEHVFSVMNAFGWIFDEPTGIWNKPGFKENGVFIHITPTEKPKRKSGVRGGGRKRKSGVYNNAEDIVKLIEKGHTYKDVGETYGCSTSLIRTVITKYRNEKRAS
jgi:hypothetical protein